MQFTDVELSENILNSLRKIGFEEPTSIQEKCIPDALLGKDIIGQSQTGSGKTAAFGLPIIQKIEKNKTPQALILTPTRELCEQVSQALQEYSHYSGISSKPIYGGVSYNPQMRALEKSEILVATPGRLLDHIRQGNTRLKTIKFLIIDEADKMFEMGFIEDIRKIISYVPKNRQTFLFSATFPPEVQKLSIRYLKNPLTVETESFVDAKFLKQSYYRVGGDSKLGLLLHLINQNKEEMIAIVFCATRKETDLVYQNLRKYDVKVMPIHGGHSQARRQRAIESLYAGEIKILVATDVAARGLDIRNVNYIFNWDIPASRDEYTHRIGRTARAGDYGYAISFVSMKDNDAFGNILGYGYFNIKAEKNPNFKKTHMVRGSKSSARPKKYADKRPPRYSRPSRGRHSMY
jgi:ATP-dependent RNA helicase DeaD